VIKMRGFLITMAGIVIKIERNPQLPLKMSGTVGGEIDRPRLVALRIDVAAPRIRSNLARLQAVSPRNKGQQQGREGRRVQVLPAQGCEVRRSGAEGVGAVLG